jgi:DNA mismatch endonuclease, patch repair protein
MVDTLSSEKRSWNMSRIQGKDTKPELLLRSMLQQTGFRFRKHDSRLPGRPDIVLPKYRSVIFVNGCFWHRHKGCKYAYMPICQNPDLNFGGRSSRPRSSAIKKKTGQLLEEGWKVLTVWECDLKKNQETLLSELTTKIRRCS